MKSDKPILFATSSYGYLQAAMLRSRRFTAGELARGIAKDGSPILEDKAFPDGERYHRIMTDVTDREVVLLGGTIDDRETMELLDVGQALVEQGALSLKLVVPYYSYSTMERPVNPGEVVKAKTRARLISAIPRASFGNKIYLVDLHTEGLPYYFENGLVAKHVYARDLIIGAVADLARQWQEQSGKALRATTRTATKKVKPETVKLRACPAPSLDQMLGGGNGASLVDFTLGSTDAGRAKWVESYCCDMVRKGIPVHPAFIIKRRVSGEETEVADISADVAGKFVVIYDDMIRTGGSAISAARAYLHKGALAVALVSTHGVLPGDSKKRLQDSGCFYRVMVTDTHPNAVALQDDFLQVVTIAELLNESLFNGKH